ncbi:MAG: response regulator transcription factor [Saprospirales bacterium]|nr:response regulator transcription factor [Saprospirales bacterium]
MKAIIIDDEEQSHEVLKLLLKTYHPDIQLVASGYNVAEGLALIRAHNPDLIFLDIEMPDGTGFDLLEQVGTPKFMVVFITAHNKYAVSAIHFGALDYLLKPLTSESLAYALERVREKRLEGMALEQLKMVFESFQQLRQNKRPARMIVSTMEGIHYIPIADLIRMEAQVNFTEIFYDGAKKRMIAAVNLGVYEEQFESYPELMRVHRSHMVHLLKVNTFVRGEGYLLMKDGSKVPVARGYRDEMLGRLGGI